MASGPMHSLGGQPLRDLSMAASQTQAQALAQITRPRQWGLHIALISARGCLLKPAALRAAYGRMCNDPPPNLLCFQNLAGTQLWGWKTESLMAGPEGGGTPTPKPSFLPFPHTKEGCLKWAMMVGDRESHFLRRAQADSV